MAYLVEESHFLACYHELFILHYSAKAMIIHLNFKSFIPNFYSISLPDFKSDEYHTRHLLLLTIVG